MTSTKPQIAMFRFTLGTGQSIGPEDLKSLWVRACQLPNVTVGRARGARPDDKAVYSLYAPQGLAGLDGVEQRLRSLLDERSLRVSLISLHAGLLS